MDTHFASNDFAARRMAKQARDREIDDWFDRARVEVIEWIETCEPKAAPKVEE